MLPDALPLVTKVPFTLTVAVALATVGVRVTEAALVEALYDVVACAKAGDNVPVLIARADRLALFDAARVTVTV